MACFACGSRCCAFVVTYSCAELIGEACAKSRDAKVLRRDSGAWCKTDRFPRVQKDDLS
ncbi:predicted protein [Sclerotinia sclerotiorum 1980 UF-70]|uniref:Uncharacterized protein n=1 Tax=Sclerotinia sclerotiorum (strain ATCC 18683 / 1980 / Ss-1) TaxID=665079 RepID=A7ES47_SCLS1|nr:predicted protein [Sclerotinia sclerotiorum 1980 UF-70]EDN92289.1 predicted protein [Sclerotinia sclerotiorum 1980 UF-70]